MSGHAKIAELFAASHPDEASALLESFRAKDIAAYLESLPSVTAASLLKNMMRASGGASLSHISPDIAGKILEELPVDTAAVLLRSVDPSLQSHLLKNVGGTHRRAVSTLLQYPADSAGAVMDPQVSPWPEDLSVAAALERMRQVSHHVPYYLYIVSRDGILRGVLSYWELVRADPQSALSAVLHADVDCVKAKTRLENILVHPAWQRFHALPVIDEQSRFLGVIRYKTFRHLERAHAPAEAHPVSTMLGLGELCWVGMAAVWDAMSTVPQRPQEKKKS